MATSTGTSPGARARPLPRPGKPGLRASEPAGRMRTVVIVVAAFSVALGLFIIVSALARGLGFTVGSLVGAVLVLTGGARLLIEARYGREGGARHS